jgi:hypothetical protein
MNKNAVTNLFIGIFAGLCAALLPKLGALLVAQGSPINLQILSGVYLIISLVFALIVGVLTMIFESGTSHKPRETFMAALGLPALISGTFNTAGSIGALEDTVQERRELATKLRQESDIAVFEAIGISPIAKEGSSGYTIDRLYGENSSFGLGVELNQPPYELVLAEADTVKEARQKADALRERVPTAKIAHTGDNHFLVVQGAGPQTKSEAILAATEIKEPSRGLTWILSC